MIHRALPLDLIESRARDQRKAWNGCTQNCNQGRACTCAPEPTEGGSACSEFLEDQTESADRQVAGWIVKAATVLFLVMFCVWVIAGGADPYIARIVEAMNAP